MKSRPERTNEKTCVRFQSTSTIYSISYVVFVRDKTEHLSKVLHVSVPLVLEKSVLELETVPT